MKRWLNRLAWRIVRATASPPAVRTQCAYCRKHHRTMSAVDACRLRHDAWLARMQKRGWAVSR